MNAEPSRAALIEAQRIALGPAGAFLPFPTTKAPSMKEQHGAVRRLEAAGYGGVWTNEVPGKDALLQLALLLAGTERVVLGTGVANVWSRSPHTAHGAAALLAQSYPHRFLLGLGIGHPSQAELVGRRYGSPLVTMRSYLTQLSSPTPGASPSSPYPLLIGANGPKMLALAGAMADGAIPALVAPELTSQARSAIGPGKLLVVLIDASPDAGEAGAVGANAAAHHAAGADHVVALLPMGTEFASGISRLEELAPALLSAGGA